MQIKEKRGDEIKNKIFSETAEPISTKFAEMILMAAILDTGRR
jgi:hypothetical protein